jgi:hypothetical protein
MTNFILKYVSSFPRKEAINTVSHQQDLKIIRMCQCLICDCWWYNYCGVCCGGCHEANLIYSWWCCKPEDLRLIDPECCHICKCDGLGYNCLYYGSICCAPQAVIEWSRLRSGGQVGLGAKTIIINNSMPSPVYMQPMQPVQGNYHITTANANYGNGMNMNVNMNGPNMEMRTDMGGMGMNTNMNYNGGMGMNTNMNVNGGMGMGGVNANVNMGGNVNMNTNMTSPGMNAKISF